MTSAQIVQLVLGAGVVAWTLRVARRQASGHLALEVGPIGRATREALAAGDRERARRLAGEGAWVSRLVLAGLDAESDGQDPGIAMAMTFRDLRTEANEGLRTLRLLARASTFVGLLAGIWEYMRPPVEELGLRALVVPVEEVASGRAMVCIAIGLGFGGFALAARGMLRGPAKAAIADCDKLRERLENLLRSPIAEGAAEGGPET